MSSTRRRLHVRSVLHRPSLETLIRHSQVIPVSRGAVVFEAGEQASALYAVVSGCIKLVLPRRGSERETVVALLRSGEVFDACALFVKGPHAVSAVAASSTRLARLPKKAVIEAMQGNPQLAYELAKVLSRRVYDLLVQVRGSAALGTGMHRTINLLSAEIPARTQAGAVTVTLPTSKRAIASKLEITPEHLSRVLKGLTSAGLISVQGRHITVHDVRRLREYARSNSGASRGRAPRVRQQRTFET